MPQTPPLDGWQNTRPNSCRIPDSATYDTEVNRFRALATNEYQRSSSERKACGVSASASQSLSPSQAVRRMNPQPRPQPLQIKPRLPHDGSLTLVYGPTKPAKHPESNSLPTKAGSPFNLTFRFYGPSQDVLSGEYFPPPLEEER